MDVSVRRAAAADGPALLAIHRAQNDFGGRWYENPFSGGRETRVEDLTPAQRWLHGGPWMDPQLLDLHLQRTAANGGAVLVAVRDSRVVGSVELWRADEPLPFGPYVDAGTLITEPAGDAEVEDALLAAAVREARGRDVRSLDIAPLHAGGDAKRLEDAGFVLLRDHRTVHILADRRPAPPEYGVRNTAPGFADLRDTIPMSHVEPPEFRLSNLGNEWAGGLLRELSRPLGGLLRVGFADLGVTGRVEPWLPEREAEVDLWVPTVALGNVPWLKQAAAAALDYVAKHHRVSLFRTTVMAHLAGPLREIGFEDGDEPDPWLRRHLSARAV